MRGHGQPSHKTGRSAVKSTPKINEVVLVRNPDAPRGTWKLGRVMKLHPGSDGAVRSVELLLPNKQRLNRSVNFLYRLEVPGVDCEDLPNLPTPQVIGEQFDGFEEKEVEEDYVDYLRSATAAPADLSMLCGAQRAIYDSLTPTAVLLCFEAQH
jgi:hypothetical protein